MVAVQREALNAQIPQGQIQPLPGVIAREPAAGNPTAAHELAFFHRAETGILGSWRAWRTLTPLPAA